uniref:Dynein light chain n=1 Tax=Denticeps clupeoides TaxID=299321 RepID=A0AAY4BUQ7_9TELE
MTDRKAVIKNADMSEDMQQDAVDCAMQSMEKYNIEKDIAEFDKKYNPTWHCIVGRNFGSYVTHETKHFIYFSTWAKWPFFSSNRGEQTVWGLPGDLWKCIICTLYIISGW